MTFDQWMKANNPKHRKSDDTVALRLLRDTWEVAREAACAALIAEIKAGGIKGIWHQADDPDECELFDTESVGLDCPACFPLYRLPDEGEV
jgi:hypothetical protein